MLFLKELPDINVIKDFIKKITPYEIIFTQSLSDIDKPLADILIELSVSMFTKRKAENKQFTINDVSFLRKVQLDQETGNFTEDDYLKVSSYFHNNIETFHKLVAQCYISKTVTKFMTDNEIFYASCKSKFCKDNVDVFFINKNGNFYVLFNELSQINLHTFIIDYLGTITIEAQSKIDELKTLKNATHKEFQKKVTEFFDILSFNIENSHEFSIGAITFFDFLGWKGIWQGNDTKPLEIVAKLIEDFRNKMNEKSSHMFIYAHNMNLSTLISISDTIAIFTPKITDISEIKLISLHSDVAKYILEKSSEEGYPIRGAISYGKYSIMNNVMIGPGIDECASWYEKCDWIGAHLTPSAQFTLQLNDEEIPENIAHEKKIPLKSGVPLIKYYVKWYISKEIFDKLRKNVEAILPEIAAKYTNTYEFLYNK